MDVDVIMKKLGFTEGDWKIITPEERCEIYGDGDCIFNETIYSDTGEEMGWIIADVADGQPGSNGPDALLLAEAKRAFRNNLKCLSILDNLETSTDINELKRGIARLKQRLDTQCINTTGKNWGTLKGMVNHEV